MTDQPESPQLFNDLGDDEGQLLPVFRPTTAGGESIDVVSSNVELPENFGDRSRISTATIGAEIVTGSRRYSDLSDEDQARLTDMYRSSPGSVEAMYGKGGC